jgi:hypothetical protein
MSDLSIGRSDLFDKDIKIYEIYRKYVEHENELINDRVGWFIQLHSFLIATYGIVVNSLISTFFSEHLPYILPVWPQLIGCAILIMIEVVGLLSSRAASRSIGAAISAIKVLNEAWKQYPISQPGALHLPGLTGGGSEEISLDGFKLLKELPRALYWLWIVSTLIPVLFAVLGVSNSYSMTQPSL